MGRCGRLRRPSEVTRNARRVRRSQWRRARAPSGHILRRGTGGRRFLPKSSFLPELGRQHRGLPRWSAGQPFICRTLPTKKGGWLFQICRGLYNICRRDPYFGLAERRETVCYFTTLASSGYRSMNTKLALSALVAALMLTACAKQEAASTEPAAAPPPAASSDAAPAAPAGDAAAPAAAPAGDAAAPAAPAGDASAPAAPADAGKK